MRLALRATLWGLLTLAQVTVLGERSWAQGETRTEQRLRLGRRLYRDQEYRNAVRELTPVALDSEATTTQKLEALELVGLSQAILGDEAAARKAFESLLELDPTYELDEPSGSPKIRRLFAEVKRAHVPQRPPKVELEHTPPATGHAGRWLLMLAQTTEGGELVSEVVLSSRHRGQSAFAELRMRRGEKLRWRAHLRPASPGVLEYYIEARDVTGRTLFQIGGPDKPLSVLVRAVASVSEGTTKPWYRRWYVWAGAGAVLAGTAAVLWADRSEPIQNGTLPPGTIDLGQ